jgi:aminoglycoside phosphotransferase (APT) family kinase protein
VTTGEQRPGKALASILAACGVGRPGEARITSLGGGTYNSVWHVTLPDGRAWVLKVPPPPGTPGLAYERGLLRGEAAFYGRAAGTGVPVPEVVHTRFDPVPPVGAHLVMTALPGSPWPAHVSKISQEEHNRLRTDLGRHMARLHAVTGSGFGYPANPLAGPTWRQAFALMLDAVLQDARRYRAALPQDPDRIAALLARASDVLDDVTRPALVHFDLWQGNLLLDEDSGGLRISGVIDGERMFWGDPLADFVSLALFDDISQDAPFLEGYAAGGGHVEFDASARLRLALYRCYLYLIMSVEGIPRRHDATQTAWTRQSVAPQLRAALLDVALATGSTR